MTEPIASVEQAKASLLVYEDKLVFNEKRKETHLPYHWVEGVTFTPCKTRGSGWGKLAVLLTKDVPDDFENGALAWAWFSGSGVAFRFTEETNDQARVVAEAIQARLETARDAEINKRIAESSGAVGATSIPVVYLGGCGTPFPVGLECLLSFDEDGVALAAGDYRIQEPSEKITSFEIGGPGASTSNIGVMGGGFGLPGALIGMASAAAVNAVTSRTTISTFIAFSTDETEVFLHTSVAGPDELRIALSAPLKRMHTAKPAGHDGDTDVAAQLTQLASLRSSGLLTEDEFAQAKARLLGSS